MKRTIIAVLFMPIIFCSCNNGIIKSGVSLNADSLNTAFSLKVNETVYSGEMRTGEGNNLTLALNSPDEVSGLVITINENEIITEFENVSMPLMQQENVLMQLKRALSVLRTADGFVNTPEGYELKNADFSAVIDSQGNLKWIKVKHGEFYFK